MKSKPLPYPELPASDFQLSNCARVLGYCWGFVQDLETLEMRDGVRVVGFTRAKGLPFEPTGEWMAVMAYIPEFGSEMWFHQAEDVLAYMATQSQLAATATHGN